MAPSGKTRAPTRRTLLQSLVGVGVGVATGGSAYGYFYERHHLTVTRLTVPVSGLPDALSGLRIGLITDLHRSETVPHEDIAAAVDLMLRERPDLIVLGGDYVTWGDRQFVQRSAEALAPLSAPHGIFAILGNHDDDRDMPKALMQQHIQVLKDARTRLEIKGEGLELAGIRFWTRRTEDLARVLRGAKDTVILLAHDPRRLPQAAQLNVPLMLSGHTHGGQVVLPGIGAVAGRGFPVLAGMERRENTTVFVSRGVGTVYVPFRLNCPPEVAVLTLSPKQS